MADEMRRHTLYLIRTTGDIRIFVLESDTKFGRNKSGDGPGIYIDSLVVSREHGEFLVDGDQVLYRNLSRTNGTTINGIHYSCTGERVEKKLEDGDVLKIDTNDVDDLHPDAVLIIYRYETVRLGIWRWYELSDGVSRINVGREVESSDIYIKDKTVSRKHGLFFRGEMGWAVGDLQSANGTWLNNRELLQNTYLKPFDCVRIADVFFVYMGQNLLIGAETEDVIGVNPRPVTASVSQPAGRNLYIHIEKRTAKQGMKTVTLLRDIDMTIRAGEMVLVLGGSGAGKTTFMNAVMGYEKADGTIRYGNVDVYSQYEQMKYEIGFVPQDTLLRESDTVYETLYNAAEMKMPASTSPEQRKERVDYVLEMVNLKHVAGSLIRSISGGEKKRVSAGVELVADPGLFFLDEPDSGLDAQSAVELMENLRYIADMGKIVMVISHSPDRVARLFDKVVVLIKSSADQCGHLAFFGSINQAYGYFDAKSLEGIVGKINARDGGGEQYIERWKLYGRG